MLENKVNQTSFKAMRAKLAAHPIEDVGAKLRHMMPWIQKGALVDKDEELIEANAQGSIDRIVRDGRACPGHLRFRLCRAGDENILASLGQVFRKSFPVSPCRKPDLSHFLRGLVMQRNMAKIISKYMWRGRVPEPCLFRRSRWASSSQS
jgi:hypothetical protein